MVTFSFFVVSLRLMAVRGNDRLEIPLHQPFFSKNSLTKKALNVETRKLFAGARMSVIELFSAPCARAIPGRAIHSNPEQSMLKYRPNR